MAKTPVPKHLNICLIAPKFPVIGHAAPAGFIWPILRGLSMQDHKITIFSWSNALGEPIINQDGVTTYFLSEMTKVKNIAEFSNICHDIFIQEHQKSPFHIVHSLTRDGLSIGERKRKLKVAVAYDVHATLMNQLFSYIGMSEETASSKIKNALKISYTFLNSYFKNDRHLLSTADGIFVTSPQQKLMLERYYMYPELKIHNVPYSVDLQDLSLRQKSENLRKTLHLPMNAKVAVTVTDMTETTDMIHILRAFQQVVVKKPSARLIIVGSGPFYKQIEYEMLSLALGSKVIMTGHVPPYEVAEYIDLADVYINLSSRSAGFESHTFEAMAQQKIVIGSEVSPLSNVIDDAYDGFLIRPADTLSLSELVIDIFAQGSSYEPIGARAREKILDLFDLKKLIQQTLNSYQQILASTRWYTK